MQRCERAADGLCMLRMPAPAVANNDGEQLGLATPQFQDVELAPAVFRKAESTKTLLVSGSAVKAVLGTLEFNSAEVLFETALGVVIDGDCVHDSVEHGRDVGRRDVRVQPGAAGAGSLGSLEDECRTRRTRFMRCCGRALQRRTRSGRLCCAASTRPGVLVEENELVTTVTTPDCFRLRWLDATVDAANALPVATMTCEVLYETAGTPGVGGLDRGRLLSAMDAELVNAVNACPQNSAKQNYAALANGGSATAMSTNIWWSNVVLGPAGGEGGPHCTHRKDNRDELRGSR